MTWTTRSACLALLALAGCAVAPPDAPDPEGERSLAEEPPSADRTVKMRVCHYDEWSDTFHEIEVSERASGAHLDHGDYLWEEEVCGDLWDNDCDGVVDDDCCPCFSTPDLDAAFEGQRYTCNLVGAGNWDSSLWGTGGNRMMEAAAATTSMVGYPEGACILRDDEAGIWDKLPATASEAEACLERVLDFADKRDIVCE